MSAGNTGKRGSNAKRRRGARQKAMQALYQWDFDQAANPPERVITQFCELQNMEKVDVEYFTSLFTYTVENIGEIDAEIARHLDREPGQLDPIERSVLRVCCTELKNQPGTPYKVVVNEALEISKDFGADKGYRYINGIADKLAAALRTIEYVADHPGGNPLSEAAIKEPVRKSQAGAVKISIKEKSDESNKPSPGTSAAKSQSGKKSPTDSTPSKDARAVDRGGSDSSTSK